MTCTLIHGDCIKEMQKLIEKEVKVDMVLTDPPYGIDLTPQRETSQFYETKVLNDDNLDWLPEWVELTNKISKNIVIMFCDWQTIGKFQECFEKYFKLKNVLVWNKDWIGMGNNYRPTYELILLFCKDNLTTKSNNKSNILTYRKIPPQNLTHSCQKPVELIEDLIYELTDENDTILDCFMGSGSTGVACLQNNRNFIGIELDENYYNIAKQRCKTYQSKLW